MSKNVLISRGGGDQMITILRGLQKQSVPWGGGGVTIKIAIAHY